MNTFTNLPTTTYVAVEPSKDPFMQINTTLCDISCTYAANDTVCVWGHCTHMVYVSQNPSYNECRYCNVKTSFCLNGFCYRLGNVGDICQGDDQCQSQSCGQTNLTSLYNVCLNVNLPPTSIVPQVLYSIIAIGLLLLCACMVRRNVTHKRPPRQIYSTRRIERNQRDEEETFAFETENADTLPPYEAAPPKYDEARIDVGHPNEQGEGSGEQVLAANSVTVDVTNSSTNSSTGPNGATIEREGANSNMRT